MPDDLPLLKFAVDPKKKLGPCTFRIDRPKGFKKEWPGGRNWVYPCDYGYFPRGILGEDGEGLDAFVGDDPDGHLESFEKLKSDGSGDLDETKFLVGVSDAERKKIYTFYGKEVGHKEIYASWRELEAALQKFKGKSKARYKLAAALYGVTLGAATGSKPSGILPSPGAAPGALGKSGLKPPKLTLAGPSKTKDPPHLPVTSPVAPKTSAFRLGERLASMDKRLALPSGMHAPWELTNASANGEIEHLRDAEEAGIAEKLQRGWKSFDDRADSTGHAENPGEGQLFQGDTIG